MRCKYCKALGHVVEHCKRLQQKNKREAENAKRVSGYNQRDSGYDKQKRQSNRTHQPYAPAQQLAQRSIPPQHFNRPANQWGPNYRQQTFQQVGAPFQPTDPSQCQQLQEHYQVQPFFLGDPPIDPDNLGHSFMNVAIHSDQPTSSDPSRWILDTGASTNATPHRHLFSEYASHPVGTMATDAQGNPCEALGYGVIHVTVRDTHTSQPHVLTLFAQHVPSLQNNLLGTLDTGSMSLDGDELASSVIENVSKLFLVTNTNGKQLHCALTPYRANFAIQSEPPSSPVATLNQFTSLTGEQIRLIMDRHQEWGHRSAVGLMKLMIYQNDPLLRTTLKTITVRDISNVIKQCGVCLVGNATRRPHKQRTPPTMRPLEVVQVDLLFMPKSAVYWVAVDLFSSYVFAIEIGKKSNAHAGLKAFLQCVGCPKTISSDWEPSFRGEFSAMMNANNITWQHTSGFTQHAAQVERMNRTLQTTPIKLMLDSGFPQTKTFQHYAILHTVEIANSIPKKLADGRNLSPNEVIHGDLPDPKRRVPFGNLVATFIPHQKRGGRNAKLSPRSEVGFNLGFADSRNTNPRFTHRSIYVWYPSRNKIGVSNDYKVSDTIMFRDYLRGERTTDPTPEGTTDDEADMCFTHGKMFVENSTPTDLVVTTEPPTSPAPSVTHNSLPPAPTSPAPSVTRTTPTLAPTSPTPPVTRSTPTQVPTPISPPITRSTSQHSEPSTDDDPLDTRPVTRSRRNRTPAQREDSQAIYRLKPHVMHDLATTLQQKVATGVAPAIAKDLLMGQYSREHDPESKYVKAVIAFIKDTDLVSPQASTDEPSSFQQVQARPITHATKPPRSIKQLQAHSRRNEWMTSLRQELVPMITSHGSLCQVHELDPNVLVIPSFLITTEKQNGRLKSRLVASGNREPQGHGEKFLNFAPVSSSRTLRTFLAVAMASNQKLFSLDVKQAFMQSEIQKDIAVLLPPLALHALKLDTSKKYCIKLLRSLYGLRSSPSAWYKLLVQTLLSIGFQRRVSDPCLMTYRSTTNPDERLWILLYVDDIAIAASNDTIALWFRKQLEAHFEITWSPNPKKFLGLDLVYQPSEIKLTMQSKIMELATKYKQVNTRPIDSPMNGGLTLRKKPTSHDKLVDTTEYRMLLGSLAYIAFNLRSDAANAVSTLARVAQEPTQLAYKAALRVVRYLYHSKHRGLLFHNRAIKPQLKVWTDASFGPTIVEDSAKSRTGYVITLGGMTLDFGSRTQTTVAPSAAHAELEALFMAAKHTAAIQDLLYSMDIEMLPATILCDNQTAIHCVKTVLGHRSELSRTQFVKVEFVKELIKNHILNVEYVSTHENVADVLTKPLVGTTFDKFTSVLVH